MPRTYRRVRLSQPVIAAIDLALRMQVVDTRKTVILCEQNQINPTVPQRLCDDSVFALNEFHAAVERAPLEVN